jgi:hypothetical protein
LTFKFEQDVEIFKRARKREIISGQISWKQKENSAMALYVKGVAFPLSVCKALPEIFNVCGGTFINLRSSLQCSIYDFAKVFFIFKFNYYYF